MSSMDEEFRDRLFRRSAPPCSPSVLKHDFTVMPSEVLYHKDLGSILPILTCHRSAAILAEKHAILATDSTDCANNDTSPPSYCVVPQSRLLCASCEGVFFWVSHRGDTFCYRCRPPKRNSASFVKQRLIWNDELQALEDFDEALAAVGGWHGDQADRPGLARPQRPRRGGAGEPAPLPGPPPGMSIDAWWESLVEPNNYFAAMAEGDRHRELESRSERALAERQAALAKKTGRDSAGEKNRTLTEMAFS